MRKSYILIVPAIVIALVSCTEVLPEKEASNPGMNKIVFSMAPEAVTKTALLDADGKPDPDGVTPYWQNGDKIIILGEDHPSEVITVIEENMHGKKEYASTTEFDGEDPFYGVYPEKSSPSQLSGSAIKMTIPSEQTGEFKDAHFCAAQSFYTSQPGYSRTYHLDFYPVAPILHFKKSDFQSYNYGKYLIIDAFFRGKGYDVDATDSYDIDCNKQIVGDISVEFDKNKPKVTTIPAVTATSDVKQVRVLISDDSPDDIYIALWPGISTSDFVFQYAFGQASISSGYTSFPVRNVTLECNKVYPAFFGRRITTVTVLNEFLADNNLTNGGAHFLLVEPSLYNNNDNTVLFNAHNSGYKFGIDFPVNTESGKEVSFDLAEDVSKGPSDLVIVVPKGKNITLNFSDKLRDYTTITVNTKQVNKSTYVVK